MLKQLAVLPFCDEINQPVAIRACGCCGWGSLACVLFLCFCSMCYGQSNEIAFTTGVTFSPKLHSLFEGLPCTSLDPLRACNTPVTTTGNLSYEGAIAHRLANLHETQFYLDLPFMGTPSRDIRLGLYRQNYSDFFFTPGLRVKFSLPMISPFAVIGGGLAHFSSAAVPQDGVTASSNTTKTWDFGGGLDFKTPIPHIALRGEFRQFHSGSAGFHGPDISHTDRFVGAGVVLKF